MKLQSIIITFVPNDHPGEADIQPKTLTFNPDTRQWVSSDGAMWPREMRLAIGIGELLGDYK